jgi:UDP-2,3-diacylglucosamine hydrolase
MGDFFETQLGIPIHRDSLDIEYANKKMHLIHGDGLAKADGGYRLLKRILRNRFNIWLYRKLPPDWAYPLALYVSGSSRNYTRRRDPSFAPDYAAYAKNKLTQGYDVVVIGHLHIPVIEQVGSGTYINTGDFIDNFSYLKCSVENISLLSLVNK